MDLMKYLEKRHIVNELQRSFGEMIVRRSDLADENESGAKALEVLAAVALRAVQECNTCLDMEEWCSSIIHDAGEEQRQELADCLESWRNECGSLRTNAVAAEGDDGAEAPLVMCYSPWRVYLRRFFRYECNVASIVDRLADEKPALPVLIEELKKDVHEASRFFQLRKFEEDMQQQAVFNALRSNLCVITGGPGRGKTTVLTDILALELKYRPEVKIALCAPTGKAAARMRQSINNALRGDLNNALFPPDVFDVLRELKARTVHGLLGMTDDTDYPVYNRKNTLNFDVIAVDECSMMSLQLFNMLLNAIPEGAKLILLGDENQLASVDEGIVLAELCHSPALENRNDPRIVNRLSVNYRAGANRPLCDYMDEMVRDNACPDVDGLFSEKYSGIPVFHGERTAGADGGRKLRKMLAEALEKAEVLDKWKNIGSLDGAFECMDAFKVLSPVREGERGVMRLNVLMRDLLEKKQDYDDGVPVMVTKNDPVTGLMNGDIGVCFDGNVWFRILGMDGNVTDLSFNPVQLPPHECAFAMTIHKSQGSDYRNVFMVLPDRDNPVMTMELIYTGISRAKVNLFLLADMELLKLVQKRRTIRWSGLGKRI